MERYFITSGGIAEKFLHLYPSDVYINYSVLEGDNRSSALACLSQARNADLWPRRATETSNKIAKQAAEEFDVPLADVNVRFIRASKEGILGNDLFLGHTHLNDEGNIILQDVLFNTIVQSGLVE